MAERLKSVAPGIPIIVGGPFATMNADRILKDCPQIDCVGVGEGEELLPDYLSNLHDPGSVAGLVWRNGDEIVQNRARPLIRDLDRFPYPDRPSLPIDYIESLPLDVPAVLSLDKFCTMQTSRGCPYSCIYCDIPSLSDGKWRCRSPEHVLGEMQELNDLGYRSIYLTDDHFLIKRERINAICRGITERKLQFHWGCEGRVDSGMVDQLGTHERGQLQFPGLWRGVRLTESARSPEEEADPCASRAGGQRSQAAMASGGFTASSSSDRPARRRRISWTASALPHAWSWTPSVSIASVSTGAPRSGRNTWTGGSSTTSGIGRNGSSAPTLTRRPCRVRRSTDLRMKGYALLFACRLLKRPLATYKLLRAFGRHMKADRHPEAARQSIPPSEAYPPARAARQDGGRGARRSLPDWAPNSCTARAAG